jgi:putative endonuclease
MEKSKNKIKIGKQIEDLAAIYLQNHKLRLLTRNFRSRCGEIDLVFKDFNNEQIVFVEVKYKKSDFFGEAVCSVNKTKQIKLIKTAHYYLEKHFNDLPISYRFDIISCSGPLNLVKINWIINAFY